ncbi:MAG: TatD family hydrolase [Bacteroidota bacterium]
MLVDTHAHLYLNQFDKDRAATLSRARENGIERIYLPNIDHTTIDDMLAMETQYPDQCFPMMGLHPCSVKANYEEELATVKQWLEKRPFCAIGEIGIDLYWDKTFFEEQKKAFLRQIAWAKDLGRPIVIHSRESTDIIIDLLRAEKDDRLRGIFHCFGGSVEQAQAIIDLGFYLGIGGVLTFKKSGLDQTMKQIDLEHVVLETDAPYLAPTPFRGKRNESAYIHQIASHLASIKSTSLAEVASITTANALKVFEV